MEEEENVGGMKLVMRVKTLLGCWGGKLGEVWSS